MSPTVQSFRLRDYKTQALWQAQVEKKAKQEATRGKQVEHKNCTIPRKENKANPRSSINSN